MAVPRNGWQHLQRLTGTFLLGITLSTSARAEALYRYTDFGLATPTDINAGGDVVLEGGYKGVYHSYGSNAGKVSGPTSYGLNPSDTIRGITDSGGVWGARPGFASFFAQGDQVRGFDKSDGEIVSANTSGQVVLRQSFNPYPDGGPAIVGYRSAIDQGGQRTSLGALDSEGQASTSAVAINNAGQVTGLASPTAGYPVGKAFRYENGQLSSLGTLGGTFSSGSDINDLGHIVGYSQVDGSRTHAFLAKASQMVDLGTLTGHDDSSASGINDAGQIVGSSSKVGDSRAFLWDSGTMKDLNSLIAAEPGYTLRRAIGINDAGQTIGIATGPDGIDRGFLLTPMSMAAPGSIPPAVPEPGTWAIFGALALGLAAHNRRRARRRA